MRGWAFLLVGLAIFFGGCVAASSVPSGRVGVAYEVPVRCSDALFAANAPVGNDLQQYQIIGGVVALPTASSARTALQTSATNHFDSAFRLFAKTGLYIRADAELELRVPPEFQDRVAIGWGDPGTPTHAILAFPCDADEEWLSFIGGIWIADPECIALEVVTGGVVETFKMGVGTACPGQEAPVGRSDS